MNKKVKEINVTKIENEVLELNQKLEVKSDTFDDAYSEQLDFSFRFKLDETASLSQIKSSAKKIYLDLEKKKNNSIQKFYIFRVFEYSFDSNEYLKKSLDTIETHISLLNQNYEVLKKELERYEIDDMSITNTYMYDRLNQFYLYNLDLEKSLDDIQKGYYKKLRAVSFSFCANKSILELSNLVDEIKKFILDYKDLETAVSFITYHSVTLITDTINQLLKILDKRTKERYDIKYFTNSEAFVCLSMGEWINLFNKLKYVINLYNIDRNTFKEFYKLFDELELFYIILLINFEKEEEL
ncbi:MAG: hypothetical protein ACOX4W_04280 [Bacilli bacterium]